MSKLFYVEEPVYQVNYFAFFASFYGIYKTLSPKEWYELEKAMLTYVFEGQKPVGFTSEKLLNHWKTVEPTLTKSVHKAQNKKGKTKSN